MTKRRRKGEIGVSLHSYDSAEVSDATGKDTGSESLVQQHLRDEVDINTIVRRFGLTREMPSGVAGGVYGDFSGISDFESAMEMIQRARKGFNVLPPEVRERFGNDPARLIRFAQEASESDFMAATQKKPPVVPPGGGVEPPPVVSS